MEPDWKTIALELVVGIEWMVDCDAVPDWFPNEADALAWYERRAALIGKCIAARIKAEQENKR